MCDVKSSAVEHSPDALRSRTKQFALRVMRLVRSLPNTAEARVIGSQVLRSGTAIGANYRAAGRGRSRTEFAAKLGRSGRSGRDIGLPTSHITHRPSLHVLIAQAGLPAFHGDFAAGDEDVLHVGLHIQRIA
ncbi:MAG: four helix bundle protein, partial [Terriglobales bacterium]